MWILGYLLSTNGYLTYNNLRENIQKAGRNDSLPMVGLTQAYVKLTEKNSLRE